MAGICDLGITVGAWIADRTVIAHPIESTWVMLFLIGCIAWRGANSIVRYK